MTQKLKRISFTIACSSLLFSCVTTTPLPANSAYAPREVSEAFMPSGVAVKPSEVKDLTLEELLVFADQHAPILRRKRMESKIVDAEKEGAEALFPENPELRFAVGSRRNSGKSGIDFEIGLDQKISISGSRGAAIEAVNAKQNFSASSLNEARWQIHVEAHRLFVDLLLVEERRKQAEKFVDFSKSLHEIASKKVDAGESPPVILLVAEADLAQTQEAVIEASEMYADLRSRLAYLIGWPGDLPILKGQLPDVEGIPSLKELYKIMEDHHPALRSRELDVFARQQALRVEEKRAWPEPTLGLSYGQESSLETNQNATDLIFFNLSFPVAIWQRNQAGRANANAEIWVADSKRTETYLRLKTELKRAVIRFNAAQKRKQIYGNNVLPKLEKNLEHLHRAYDLGEVDIHQVSQTRERLLDASARYLNARIQFYETAIDLGGLVGTEMFEKVN